MKPSRVNYNSDQNSVSSSSYLNSKNVDCGYIQFNIACGFISTTEVCFVNEGILALVFASGRVEFYDMSGNLLASIYDPASSEGRGRYQDVCCKVVDNKIMLRFPYYNWSDNYPDCDGESDRWSAYITAYKSPIAFDLGTHDVSIVAE